MNNKKPVHPKYDITSNRNNSGTICQNHLKFDVRWVPIGDSTHINFQVNWTNRSRIIAVGSWVIFWVDWFFSPLSRGLWYTYHLGRRRMGGRKETFSREDYQRPLAERIIREFGQRGLAERQRACEESF